MITGFDITARLARVACPTMALVANRDVNRPQPYAVALASAVQCGCAAVISGAAHLTPLDRPPETTRVIAHWVEQGAGEAEKSKPETADDI